MRADQPDLLTTIRPDSLPAVVQVVPRPGVRAGDVADALTEDFPPPVPRRTPSLALTPGSTGTPAERPVPDSSDPP